MSGWRGIRRDIQGQFRVYYFIVPGREGAFAEEEYIVLELQRLRWK